MRIKYLKHCQCLYFSVKVEKGSTPIKVKFKSNLFGSLGAGVFVGPNTIDFGSVFDDLDKKIAEVSIEKTLFSSNHL